MLYRISVTQQDIDNGTRCCEKSCPHTIAIRRVIGYEKLVNVDISKVVFSRFDDGKRVSAEVDLDSTVSAWINAYDKGRHVSPIEYNLSIPDEFIQSAV